MNATGQYTPQEAADMIANAGKCAMQAMAAQVYFSHGLDKAGVKFTMEATVREVK